MLPNICSSPSSWEVKNGFGGRRQCGKFTLPTPAPGKLSLHTVAYTSGPGTCQEPCKTGLLPLFLCQTPTMLPSPGPHPGSRRFSLSSPVCISIFWGKPVAKGAATAVCQPQPHSAPAVAQSIGGKGGNKSVWQTTGVHNPKIYVLLSVSQLSKGNDLLKRCPPASLAKSFVPLFGSLSKWHPSLLHQSIIVR